MISVQPVLCSDTDSLLKLQVADAPCSEPGASATDIS